jgi:hypothetical protein
LRIFRLLSIRKNEFFMSDKEWVKRYLCSALRRK